MILGPKALLANRAMKSEPAVFIVGPARSGTTILYRLLQQHSQFRPKKCEFGVSLTESKSFIQPHLVYDDSLQNGSSPFTYMLCDKENYRAFRKAVWGIRLWQRLYNKVKPNETRIMQDAALRMERWRQERNSTLMREYFYYAKRARGAERLLEKTPEHLRRLPEIWDTFPKAQVICIFRHPVEIFTSYRRRYQAELQEGNADPKSLSWLEISVPTFCEQYANLVRIATNAQARDPERFRMVRYEDLTAGPRETVTDLLAFLGEEFEEACLVKDVSDKVSWKVDPHLFSTVKQRTKDWRDYITPEEVEALENGLSQAMGVLDYESRARPSEARDVDRGREEGGNA